MPKLNPMIELRTFMVPLAFDFGTEIGTELTAQHTQERDPFVIVSIEATVHTGSRKGRVAWKRYYRAWRKARHALLRFAIGDGSLMTPNAQMPLQFLMWPRHRPIPRLSPVSLRSFSDVVHPLAHPVYLRVGDTFQAKLGHLRYAFEQDTRLVVLLSGYVRCEVL